MFQLALVHEALGIERPAPRLERPAADTDVDPALGCRNHAAPYSSPRLLKLAWPLRPITRWSWIEIPSAPAAVLTSRVISMSSRDGLGSPEGWLCSSV